MKFVTYSLPGGAMRPGLALDDGARIADLGDLYPSMLALIEAGEQGLAQAAARAAAPGETHPRAAVHLHAPIPNPPRLRDCSVFEDHVLRIASFAKRIGLDFLATVPQVWYDQPAFYKGNHLAMGGPDDGIPVPAGVQKLDYELEIACVIGKRGKDVPAEQGLDHIFGLTIYNDLTARDYSREMENMMGPAKAKDFDGSNIIGPWIVTLDELDLTDMPMIARHNGAVIGEGNAADMYHDWGRIVAHLSLSETIYPGEVVGSGTIGPGTLAETGKSLQPGDVVEFEVGQLGVLRMVVGNR